jgi:hypothetical protein
LFFFVLFFILKKFTFSSFYPRSVILADQKNHGLKAAWASGSAFEEVGAFHIPPVSSVFENIPSDGRGALPWGFP